MSESADNDVNANAQVANEVAPIVESVPNDTPAESGLTEIPDESTDVSENESIVVQAENQGEKMETDAHVTSLSSIADARPAVQPGNQALGVGLEARGIHAWFGEKHALSDVSLDFWPGTVTALIGPSGCGKSTFIRTLNRMHEFIPTAAMAGEVLLNGEDIYAPGVDVTKIRLKVGMVFQKPNPFPSMTIAENVLAGLKLAQLKVENKNELLQECLERAGLWSEVKDRLNTHGGALSGGQQQRLCIARALAVRPQVLLMDEPCSALGHHCTCSIGAMSTRRNQADIATFFPRASR